MAWLKGSTTDWHDMMDILSNIGADEHMSAYAIYDGGSGYAIGDTIALGSGTYNLDPELEVRGIQTGDTVATIASIVAGGANYNVGDLVHVVGGTYTVQAVLEVTSETGGAVDGLQINDPGVYSVKPTGTIATAKITGTGDDNLTVTLTWNTAVTGIATDLYITNAGAATATPSDPVSTTTSGSGTGLLVDLTWTETAWATKIKYEPKVAVSATISAGGTGYAVDDILIVDEGSGTMIEDVQFIVTGVSGDAVTSVSVTVEGYYAALPSNPVSTTAHPSTPGGSGCTLTVTWTGYTESTYQNFKFLILHNTVKDVYVGVKAFNETGEDADVWQLAGFTGFNSITTKFDDQPGFTVNDVFVPLHDGAFEYNLSITDRKILGVFNLGSGANYTNMFLGLMDPFMTEVEYPYPQLVLGCSTEAKKYTYSGKALGGLNNPGAFETGDEGPGLIRYPGGELNVIRNWYIISGSITESGQELSITPLGNQTETPDDPPEEQWYGSHFNYSWWKIVGRAEEDDPLKHKIKRLNDFYVLIPCLLSDYTNRRFLGSLPGVYWFDNADGNMSANDRIWINGVAYRVFQNCNKTNKNNMFCVEEG